MRLSDRPCKGRHYYRGERLSGGLEAELVNFSPGRIDEYKRRRTANTIASGGAPVVVDRLFNEEHLICEPACGRMGVWLHISQNSHHVPENHTGAHLRHNVREKLISVGKARARNREVANWFSRFPGKWPQLSRACARMEHFAPWRTTAGSGCCLSFCVTSPDSRAESMRPSCGAGGLSSRLSTSMSCSCRSNVLNCSREYPLRMVSVGRCSPMSLAVDTNCMASSARRLLVQKLWNYFHK